MNPTPATERPWEGRRVHFVGVGGAGMSGYARAVYALGAHVSGSDRHASPYTERLAADGVLQALIGEHDAANVPAGEDVEVVYSSAVAPENPERAAARERGLRERPRAELLGELSALRRTIAVAGTHGKTTTAAMVVWALRAAGLQPDWLIGGSLGEGLENAGWSGAGEWLVVEADESDRSMLSLHFEIAVLTNVELDHHATFGSLVELREAFRVFLARASSAIVMWDRPELLALLPSGARPADAASGAKGMGEVEGSRSVVEVRSWAESASGIETGAGVEVVPYDAPAPALLDGGSRFTWRGHEVTLSVPGAHNALNATAALEAARLAGADAPRAIAGVCSLPRRGTALSAAGGERAGRARI